LGNLVGQIWKMIAVQPIINLLLVLSHYLFNNFGLALIALTIISKAVLYPVNMKQIKTTRAMQEIQPKLVEIQRKYARDKQRLAREQMALYKEAGASPVGCAIPLLIQLPIMIALYQAITRILATFPDDFLGLSQYLYPLSIVYTKLPLKSDFLWLNLSLPDQYFILPVLTGITMWLQQKQIAVAAVDPQQESQQKIMLWSMPVVFTYISLSFPSGLGLYWVLSSVISIGTQYFVSGWGGLADIKNTRLRWPWGSNVATKPLKRSTRSETSLPKGDTVETINTEKSTNLKIEESKENVGSDNQVENPNEPKDTAEEKGPAPAPPNPRKFKGRHSKGK
jgi:YidC/Oxa1 family membrane protein insertase